MSVGHPNGGLLYTGIRRADANSTTHGVKAELLLEQMTPPVASATTGKQVLRASGVGRGGGRDRASSVH